MKRLLSWFRRDKPGYDPLISVTLSRGRLIHNLHEFMRIAPGHQVAPVLKSNAYGHGLLEVARILEHENNILKKGSPRAKLRTNVSPCHGPCPMPYFVVDSFYEASRLRAARIRTPILVIGYTRPEIILHSRIPRVHFVITSIDSLRHLGGSSLLNPHLLNRKIPIHLKIDTGMHRQGLLPEEIEEAEKIIDNSPHIIVTGICSHLADADNADPSFSESQIHIWNRLVTRMRLIFPTIEHIHISNTDGHRFVSDSYATFSRLGIGLYGLTDGNAFSPPLNLKPVMQVTSTISGIKKIRRDDAVGYASTFKAEHDMTIATIPFGYYEGMDRRLSNNGFVLVGPEHAACPIIGRVSMNITTIDVSHVPNISAGTEVTIISDGAQDYNSIVSIAKRCSTIAHEIAVHINGSLRRIVVD
jgi:alanine racemase